MNKKRTESEANVRKMMFVIAVAVLLCVTTWVAWSGMQADELSVGHHAKESSGLVGRGLRSEQSDSGDSGRVVQSTTSIGEERVVELTDHTSANRSSSVGRELEPGVDSSLWQDAMVRMGDCKRRGDLEGADEILGESIPSLIAAVGEVRAEALLARRARACQKVYHYDREDHAWEMMLDAFPLGRNAAEGIFRRARHSVQRRGDRDFAIALLDSIDSVVETPWTLNCLDLRGDLAIGQQDYPKAQECYERVVSSHVRWNADHRQFVNIKLAKAYLYTGDLASAGDRCDLIIEEFPWSLEAREAKDLKWKLEQVEQK